MDRLFSCTLTLLCILSVQGQPSSRFDVTSNPTEGTSSSTTLTLDCRPSNAALWHEIGPIQISKWTGPKATDYKVIASVRYERQVGSVTEINSESINQDRISLTGTVDNPSSSYLQVRFLEVKCKDGGMYQCKVTGLLLPDKASTSVTGTGNTTIRSKPKKMTLSVYDPEDSLVDSPAEALVSSVMTMKCEGQVGNTASDQNIHWCFKQKNDRNYRTYASATIETAPVQDPSDSCQMRRRSEVKYNVSHVDVETSFKCFAGSSYTCNSDIQAVTIIKTDKITVTDPQPAVTSDAGAIAGGVIAAILVIAICVAVAVYFLKCRNTGGTYAQANRNDYSTDPDKDTARSYMDEDFAHSGAASVDSAQSNDKVTYSVPHVTDRNQNHGVPVMTSNHQKDPPMRKPGELYYADLEISKNPPSKPPRLHSVSDAPTPYAEVKFV